MKKEISNKDLYILGLFHSASDPSVALIKNGEVLYFAEEERFLRNKHAKGYFPLHALEFVLNEEKIKLEEVDAIVQPWDVHKYDRGHIQDHFNKINEQYKTSDHDLEYQNALINQFKKSKQVGIIKQNLKKEYGDIDMPDIRFVNHHLAHACTAFYNSGFKDSLVLSIDGSGEEVTTSWWIGNEDRLNLLREIKVPHSLGWFYSAFTEYLGFDAYNGEYKVMGLAAYGKFDKSIKSRIDQLVWYDGEGGFLTNPLLLSRGPRSYSYYFPDILAEHVGKPPRAGSGPIEQWHRDCAYSVQCRLEEIVLEMLQYWIRNTGLKTLCISGGVGLNVKMNGNIYCSGIVDDLFVYPLCSDAGSSIGAAMAFYYEMNGLNNKELSCINYGPCFTDEEILELLGSCQIAFSIEDEIEKEVAQLISEGHVVGWFQGRMEGGPRALGARSILADPRNIESRDKVNAVIKYREPWRPFCPSMTEEGAKRYFNKWKKSPFMIMTFQTNETAEKEVPAIVHVDHTARPQIVDSVSNPRFYKLIEAFNEITGIPVLLNTSFNIKGEPIVCNPHDAIRTFYSTGLDVLAMGNCLIRKDKWKEF